MDHSCTDLSQESPDFHFEKGEEAQQAAVSGKSTSSLEKEPLIATEHGDVWYSGYRDRQIQ